VDVVKRIAGRPQTTLREMQVDGGMPDIGVAEQRLQRDQITAAFQTMRGKGVTKGMGSDGSGNAGPLRSLSAR